MAVAIRLTAPFDLDTYDQVQAKLDLENNPPEGLILHSAGVLGDGVAIFNIWESEALFQNFREQRLLPAIAEAAGEEAAQGGPPPDQQIYELHNLVRA
jgi:hypothetical protein